MCTKHKQKITPLLLWWVRLGVINMACHITDHTYHNGEGVNNSRRQLTRDFGQDVTTRRVHTDRQTAMSMTNSKLWVLQSTGHTSTTLDALVHGTVAAHTDKNSLILQQHLQEQTPQKTWQHRPTTYNRSHMTEYHIHLSNRCTIREYAASGS